MGPYPGYAPPAPAPVVARPICWGKSFNENDRECRGCSFQTSCKEEIVRLNTYRYSPPQAPAYAAPAPVPVPVPPWQQPPRVTALPVIQAPQLAPVQPMMRPPDQHTIPPYGFGWAPDPLFYSLHAAPPMVRNQFQGEKFFERVGKNMLLSALESLCSQALLAARQMIWAPEQKPPPER
jgi:hypothetical protein